MLQKRNYLGRKWRHFSVSFPWTPEKIVSFQTFARENKQKKKKKKNRTCDRPTVGKRTGKQNKGAACCAQ